MKMVTLIAGFIAMSIVGSVNAGGMFGNSRLSSSLYDRSGSGLGRSSICVSPSPFVAENGDIRGRDNDGDGRNEPTYVRSYDRTDGAHIRGHYRALPSWE